QLRLDPLKLCREGGGLVRLAVAVQDLVRVDLPQPREDSRLKGRERERPALPPALVCGLVHEHTFFFAVPFPRHPPPEAVPVAPQRVLEQPGEDVDVVDGEVRPPRVGAPPGGLGPHGKPLLLGDHGGEVTRDRVTLRLPAPPFPGLVLTDRPAVAQDLPYV